MTLPSSVTPVTQQRSSGLGDPGWIKGAETETPELQKPHRQPPLPGTPSCTPGSQRSLPEEGDTSPSLPPHHPVLPPELRILPWLTQTLHIPGCKRCSEPGAAPSPAQEEEETQPSSSSALPHLSSPAAVAELQGWDDPHVPLASSHHYPPCN